MNIDFGTAVTGLIIVLICSAPFLVIYYKGVKKQKKTIQAINEIAQLNGCQIRQFQFCNDLAFGIDTDNRKIAFFRAGKNKPVSQCADLSTFQSCVVNKKVRILQNETIKREVIEAVELIFTPKDKKQEAFKLEFYHMDLSAQLSGELQFAQLCEAKINAVLGGN